MRTHPRLHGLQVTLGCFYYKQKSCLQDSQKIPVKVVSHSKSILKLLHTQTLTVLHQYLSILLENASI